MGVSQVALTMMLLNCSYIWTSQRQARRSCPNDETCSRQVGQHTQGPRECQKTRCSVLPALDIDGCLPGSTVAVEGAVTEEIFEHWLETATLPRIKTSRHSAAILEIIS